MAFPALWDGLGLAVPLAMAGDGPAAARPRWSNGAEVAPRALLWRKKSESRSTQVIPYTTVRPVAPPSCCVAADGGVRSR